MSNQHTDSEELMTQDITHDLVVGEALERLYKNEDFKTVILEGYLKEKALASVSLLGVPSMKGHRGEVMEDLVAGSNLQYFFQMVFNKLEGARDPVLSEEEEELLEQEGN